MCDHCAEHGTAKKWYLNASRYSNELAEKLDLREFLLEQYKNFEQMQVRKVNRFSAQGLGYKRKVPIIGRLIKYFAEKMVHSTKMPDNPFQAKGHFGQVVPLDDAIAILETCAVEPIIEKYCMCRWMHKGEKDACCINFGIMSEIIEKLPRFIPERDKFHLTREEAIERFKEHNRKGYIGTIWYGPYPYINNLCSCKNPECAGIRPRTQFGIKSVFKSEYILKVNTDNCIGCKKCILKCQFNAIGFDSKEKVVNINQEECYGCGVCLHACNNYALQLIPRDEVPQLANIY